MKDILNQKILDFFKEVPQVDVSWDKQTCTINLKQMYAGVSKFCSFANLNWLSKLLETEEINIRDQYYREGCESCDYGSSDELNIICYNCKTYGENP